jgi:hypothetical protein
VLLLLAVMMAVFHMGQAAAVDSGVNRSGVLNQKSQSYNNLLCFVNADSIPACSALRSFSAAVVALAADSVAEVSVAEVSAAWGIGAGSRWWGPGWWEPPLELGCTIEDTTTTTAITAMENEEKNWNMYVYIVKWFSMDVNYFVTIQTTKLLSQIRKAQQLM